MNIPNNLWFSRLRPVDLKASLYVLKQSFGYKGWTEFSSVKVISKDNCLPTKLSLFQGYFYIAKVVFRCLQVWRQLWARFYSSPPLSFKRTITLWLSLSTHCHAPHVSPQLISSFSLLCLFCGTSGKRLLESLIFHRLIRCGTLSADTPKPLLKDISENRQFWLDEPPSMYPQITTVNWLQINIFFGHEMYLLVAGDNYLH